MGRKGYSSIHVDWINITYRSVYSTVAVVLLLVASAAGGYYYKSVYMPRKNASDALTEATSAYRQASTYRGNQALVETVYRAGDALEDAQVNFDRRQYNDAQFAALHSLDLSRKAIKLGGGEASEVPDARINKLEGDVRVKRAGEFNWESAVGMMTLHIGDQVKTSSSASAEVHYFDGTVTRIEPGSLMEIRELFQDPVTRVRRVKERLSFGEVNASVQGGNVAGSYHEVQTDKVNARAEDDSEIRIAFDDKKKTTQVDVFSGKALVSSGSRSESLEGGERIRADREGKLGGREALPGVPRLRSPADQKVYVFSDPSKAEVSLSWEELKGVSTYHLMIAEKPLFATTLFSGKRKVASASMATPEGTYHWKVAAVKDGVLGPYSDVRTFRVSSQKIKDNEDSVPPTLEVNDFVSIGGMVIINGRSEPGTTLWIDNEKVDVYEDGSFNAVIRMQQEGVNEIVFIAQDNAGNETREVKSTYVDQF